MKHNIRKITSAGNCPAITIPKKFMKEHDLKKGDFIRIDKITKMEIKEADASKQKKL